MASTYTVRPGDTLSGIYGSNWKQASGYTGDPRRLAVGTVLPAPQNYQPAPIKMPVYTPSTPMPKPQPYKAPSAPNWAQQTLNTISNTIVPKAYAEEKRDREIIKNDDALAQKVMPSIPPQAKGSARQTVPLIAKALRDEGILTPQTLAYALATIQHETAQTFEPIREYGGASQARKLGYSGGENYYGRGYIQLTHDYNYKNYGKRIGLGDQLYQNPDMALDPQISAKILAAYMKDRGVADLANKGDFVEARRPVQGSYNKAWDVANYAKQYLANIPSNVAEEPLVEPERPVREPTKKPTPNKNFTMTIRDPGTDFIRDVMAKLNTPPKAPFVAPIPKDQIVPNTPGSFFDFLQKPPKQLTKEEKEMKEKVKKWKYTLTHLW